MPEFPKFIRETIWSGGPAERVLLVVGDVDNDGDPEIVVASRRGENGLYWLDRESDGGWTQHMMDTTYPSLEAGGLLYDVSGSGRVDFIGGGDAGTRHVSWWEAPSDPTGPWQRRLIHELPAGQCHDQVVADIDGDGRPELYFWNQRANKLFGVPFPDDPRVSPWPGVFVVAEDLLEEGFAVADVDGDGNDELIAGLSWYRIAPGGKVERHVYGEGFVSPRVAAADFSGDGKVEVVIAEGDASYRRKDSDFGRVAHYRQGRDPEALWEPEVLHDELEDPHSVVIGDFDGDGRPDVFIGELGSPRGEDIHVPKQRIYFNRDGNLVEHVIDEGLGTHEAKLIELDGKVGIAGKPYRGLKSEKPRTPELDGVQVWMPV